MRLIIAVTSFFTTIIFVALAQAEQNQTPEIMPPERLSAYADVERALTAASETISLLATAKFENDSTDFFKSTCDNPHNHGVVRGYELAKTAFFLFSSKMEKDWFDPAYDEPALSEPYRGVLAATWTSKNLARAFGLLSELNKLPPEVKADLHSFFEALLRHKRYHEFLMRRPAALSDVKQRIAETCSLEESRLLEAALKGSAYDWRRERKIDKFVAQNDLDACNKKRISGVLAEAKAYRELINANRDPDAPPIDACLDGQFNYYKTLVLGSKGGIKKKSTMSPNYYLIHFWLRRQNEGTLILASYALDQILRALK